MEILKNGQIVPNLDNPADRLRVDGVANAIRKKEYPDEPENTEEIVIAERRIRDIDE